jgi:hypothetical protein
MSDKKVKANYDLEVEHLSYVNHATPLSHMPDFVFGLV